MNSCLFLSCAMLFLQTGRTQAELHAQVAGHPGSDDLSWIQASVKPAPAHIRGPFWTRGLSLYRTSEKSVWAVPGPSGIGTTVGISVTLDF